MAKKDNEVKKEVLGFLGVGLDNQDDEKRLTHSKHFLLVGGSAETHERMQDIVIHFDEKLEQRGKDLRETEPEEALDILRESMDL